MSDENQKTGMFEESSGQTSALRVLVIWGASFILAMNGFVSVWSVIHKLPQPDIPLQWALCFTALIAGKVGQKYLEK